VSSSNGLPWGRLLAEGGVIVVGILPPLGAHAWWAERAERKERAAGQTALRRLPAEFESRAAQFDSVPTKHQTHMASAEVLLVLHRTADTVASDSLRTLIQNLDQAWRFTLYPSPEER